MKTIKIEVTPDLHKQLAHTAKKKGKLRSNFFLECLIEGYVQLTTPKDGRAK